tara:strand:+ start:1093 stop:3162 length:2070 start_codon:yes stop_codon:yes gene_type:complete
MKFNADKILREWSWRVGNGMPDVSNDSHRTTLMEVLFEQNFSHKFIKELVANLSEDSRDQQQPEQLTEKTFQEFCVEVGRIISSESILAESSVWDKPVGTEQLAGAQTFNVWRDAPKGPYTVVAKTADAIDVDLSPGETNPKIAYISAGGKTYKISGAKTKMSKLFKNATKKSSPFKISWGEKELESAACTGLYFDPTSYYTKIMTPNAQQSDVEGAISAFKSALGKSGEYAGASGLSAIEGIPDVIRALELANGVHAFALAHGCKGWNFIHSSIGSYYKAGYDNKNLDTSGFKDNTADTVIVKGSAQALITAMKSEKIEFDSSGKCKTESGIEFFQISNKLKKGGAQLGRIQVAFADMYGLKEPMDTWRVYLQKEITEHGEKGFLLNEGLADYFKQGLKYVKDKFTSLLDKAKNKIAKFSSSVLKSLTFSMNKPSPSLESFMKKEFDKAPVGLKEAKKPRYSYGAYAEMVARAALNNNKSYSNNLLNKAQQQWSILEKLLKVPNDGIYPTRISAGPADYTPKDVKDGANYIIKLMINFTAYEHLTKMLASSKGEIKNVTTVLEEFVELEKEMYFGKTDLPMFKVYGADISGTAWEYLKSGKEFREDKLKAMNMTDAVKDGQSVPGVIVESSVQSGKGYTAVKMWILHSITEKGTKYTQVDLRSGSRDTFSFSVSGGSVMEGSKVLGKI